ncbi:hypothetical protein Agub_g7397 [Astrephomene gubernaculifera]|uniref:Uncharacterized protein n=1 Tax=Astrephomene gubernaculifera TaxID=47775 RepID=A0AAD3HMN4_9CHLO|nr:hypothetical protein Agub_g7397 [Astrephomene gubernaculifera]
MAAAFVRRAFKGDDDAEDSPPQLPTAPKQSQIQARAIDSSGDESTTDSPPAAAIRHQSAVAAYGRFHHLISQRQDDSGDLRPTTPPTGPSPRNRQADRPAAALQPTQSDTLHGPSTGGIKEGHNGLRGTGAPIPRRHSVAGLRVGTGPPPSSTKAAAARALHSSLSSSDDDAGHGAIPDAAPAAMQEVSMRSLGHPAVASLRSTRSLSKSTPSGSLTGEAAGPSASPSRRSSIAGRASISDGGVISGSFASAAAAELAGLNAQAGGYTSRQHRASRTSRLRRVSSNASLSSKASQPESLASSRLTAGSSKVSQTVQRTIARQRLVESSSGEDEGSVRQGSCETGQEAAVGVVPNSNRESLAAAVIAAAQATAAAAAAARRHPSAPAAARHRQEAAAAGGRHDEAAFSFRASSGSSLGSDSLTPLMREATAAATAEVAAAAAASLRPLPITAISPARLSPHTRPVDVLDPPVFDEVPQGGVDDVAYYETAFVNVGSAAAAAHAAAAAAQAAKAAAMAELQNSQRIATWLEQQPRPPSLSSAGCVDDLASEQATVVVGTEVEVDVTSGAAAYGANYRINLAAHAGSALGSGGMELSGLCRHAALDSNRLRAESLTISSTDDDSDSNGGAAAAATEDCEQAHVDWQRAVDSNHMPSGGEQASAITSTAESTDASTAPTFAPVVRRLDFPGSISAGAGLSDTDKEHMSRHFFAPLERPQARSPAAAPRPAPVAAGMDSVAGAGRRVSVKPASRGAASGQHAAPGALPSRSSPAGTSARMTPSKLRAMLSILARPAHAPPASGSPSRGPILQPSQDAESVQSMSYSEMLQMLQELSPVDGISLPQPVAGASTDVASGVSKARAGRTRAGRSSGSAARHSVASAPSVGAPATSAPLRGRQQKSAEVGASGHPSHGGMTAAAATGSVLSHEDNMAAPLSQDLTNTGVTLSSHWGGGEQQQRDFADLVRLWTMLTGRRLAFEAMDNHSDAPVPTEHGASASGSPQSTTSTAQQSHATARSGGTGSDVPSSAAIWAASAAAMATSAVLAAAAGGSQQLQTAYQYQQQHPFQPGSLGATAAAHNMQSPLPYGTSTAMSSRSNPVVGPNITSSSQPGGQPNYASFASLPQELQHLARLVSAPDHTGAGGLRLQSGPGSSALPHGDLAHLSSLLVAAGISGEQQLQVSAAEQVGLVQLLRILSATGLTGAPSSATSIAQQADTVQHVGQPTEAANSAAATSIGIPAASTATTATSTAAAAPEPLEAAPQQPMDVVAAMLPDGATSSAGTAARSGNVGTVAAGPLSTHSSADTVDTGLALSRVYTALRNMRLRDEGGQTDPPGTRTSNTQTSPDLRASHMRDEEGQTDTPVSSSSGSQTENLRAGVASGVVQIDVDDLRAFATRSKAGQTDLPSCESISVQTQLAELVPTSEGSVQTDISHLRGGPCRGVQTDVAEVAPAGSQTEASWLSQALPSAATQTLDDDANLTAVFSAEVQEELARAALAAGQLSPRLSAEAQAEVLRLARVLAAAGQQAEAEQPTLSAETQAQLVRTLRTVANPVPSLEWGSVLTSVDSGHTHLSSELREGPATSDCEVQTDLTAVDFTAPNPQPDLEASSNASADSSITAAPAIPTASHLAAEPSVRMPSPPTSTQIGTAFALRNLPIASDGGIMDAPHQEAVVAGRVGSSGGMLAYLEAADPTTATALMELMQALQVMTMHKRRRRWISDGSSRASGECYHDAETPSSPPSIRRSSGAVTTLWGSFVTSIGPSVSQAGQASLAGAEAAAEAAAAEEAMAAAGAVDSATPPAVKAATVGGEGVALQADAAGCQRHSFTAGLPPRPAPPPTTAAVDSTARHLQRALRAVSNGGGHRRATGGGPMSRGTNAVTSPASAEAHIALALELLSRAAAPAAGSTSDEEAELRAQEELVAAMLALLVAPAAPSAANITGAADAAGASVVLPEGLLPASAEPSLSVAGLEALASIGQSGESLAVPQEEGYCEVDAPVASVSASDSEPDIPTAEASPLVRAEVPRSETPSPSAMLRAEIQVALQQAERASASVTSLHTGYLPATPRAAEVLDGLPFEQAVGYILDGLRNFEGPAKLARNLHLARDGSRSTSTGGASWEGLPALETQGSRLQATGIFGSGTMLAAVVEGPGKEVDDGKPQPLSGLQNEVECALPAVLPGRQDSSSASPSSKQLLMGHVEAAVEVAASASNGLVTEVPVAHASPSAVRLLEQLSDLGIISLGPADSPDAAGALRSAPVTTAGSAPAALQLFSSPTPAVVSPQTFGGAMDLPADSALGPDAHQRHSVPYLPCGGLDDQLRPVHSVLVLASTGGQEAGQSPAAVDTEDESKHGSPLLPVSTAGAFAPWLPTFAMPSAPAVNVTPQQPTRTAASVAGVESFAASPLHTMQAFAESPNLPEVSGEEQRQQQTALAEDACLTAEDERVAHDASPGQGSPQEPQMVQPYELLVGAAAVPDVLAVPRSAPTTMGGEQLPVSRPLQTAGGFGAQAPSHADPQVPTVTARERFRMPGPYRSSPLKPASPMRVLMHNVSVPVGFAASAALPLAATSSAAAQTSAWSDAADGYSDDSFPAVRLARDAMAGCYAKPAAMEAPAVEATAAGGVRRALFPNSSGAGEQQRVDEGVATAPVTDASTAAASPSNLLLTQAAQLLLQAMQRSAEDHPEQQSAFAVLAPVLAGLAATGPEGQSASAASDRALPHQSSAQAEPTAQEPDMAAAVPLAEQQQETALQQLLLESEELPPMDSSSFAFLMGEPGEAQAQTPSATATPSAVPHSPALATAADLEAFKGDIMSSVRTALMEIVDLIGHSVVQRAAATAGTPANAISGVGGNKGGHAYQPELESARNEAHEYGEAGIEEEDSHATTVGGVSVTVEPSASSYALGADQQEIRITRSELEAFMFGKALLNSSTTSDLLGVRLRDLYARQLSQDAGDEELAGGYEASSVRSQDDGAPDDDASSAADSRIGVNDPQRHSSDCFQSPLPHASRGSDRSGNGLDSSPLRGSEPGPSGFGVPRHSPLRQPLGDGVDFKSLFRRSMEHLRDHLQQHDGAASIAQRASAPSPVRGPSPTIAMASASAGPSPSAATIRKPPMPPKRPPIPQQFMSEAVSGAGLAAAAEGTSAALDKADSGAFETTFAPSMPPSLAQQLAAAAARAVAESQADLEAAARAADDVELDMPHLAARAEPTTGVAWCPDPAFPAPQSMAHTHLASSLPAESSAPVEVAISAAEAFGDFLAALAEPVVQVAGLFMPPDPRVGGRGFPQRTVVIEELREEDGRRGAEGAAAREHFRAERPSNVPGYAAGGAGWLEDEDAYVDSPRARSETSSPRLRLRHPVLADPRLQLSRSTSDAVHLHAAPAASSLDVLVSSRQQQQNQASTQQSVATPPLQQSSSTSVHLQSPHSSLPSRLKHVSVPGGRLVTESPAEEDRPLSSFASPSSVSEAGAPVASSSRRHTLSPGPLSRMAPTRSGSVGATGSAPGAPAAVPASASAASPVSRLEELEIFLQAFKLRIGADEEAVPLRALQLAATAAATGVTPSIAEVDVFDGVSSSEGSNDGQELGRTLAALAAFGEEEQGVATGYNLHTIRASAASAMAAAAAVEQVFSPRLADMLGANDVIPEEHELSILPSSAGVSAIAVTDPQPGDEAGGAGSVEDGGAGGSVVSMAGLSNSASSVSNPLLREHLEHFQALLEKANDLVDRLMVADEEVTSEAATDGTGTNATPRQRATPASASASAIRRQLHNRLTAAAAASLVVTPSSTPRRRSVQVGAVSPVLSVAGAPSTPLPSLDPELAALFPATAARLSRPHALLEQSQDAALTLVSSAVTAVPQLAVGANRARSLSTTPSSRSPTGSIISVTTVATSATITAAAPVAAAAQNPTATPLALVAALLAEAHSRMEFRSLDEQRGADKILSAVLDEHFAHVLGTPRGFLTPAREPQWLNAAAAAAPAATTAAAGDAPAAATTSQAHRLLQRAPEPQPFVGPANLSEAFNQAAVAGGAAAAAVPSPAPRHKVVDLMDEPAVLQSPDPQPATRPQPPLPLLPPRATQQQQVAAEAQTVGTALLEAAEAAAASSPQPHERQAASGTHEQPRSDADDLFGQLMQERSDILISALEQVHRVAPSSQASAEPPTAVCSQSSLASSPVTRGHSSVPDAVASAFAVGAHAPTGLPEPFTQATSQLEDQLRHLADSSGASSASGEAPAPAVAAAAPSSLSRELPAVLDALPVPATSVGPHAPLPQPLMPYQEADSESTRTSYATSLAGSIRQHGVVQPDLESPLWSRVPSAPGGSGAPSDMLSRGTAPLYVVSAGGASTLTSSLGGDSAMSAPAGPPRTGALDLAMLIAEEDSSVSAGADSNKSPVQLPLVPSDSASRGVGMVDGKASSNAAGTGRVGGGGRSDYASPASASQTPVSPAQRVLHESTSESETFLSYTTGDAVYEHRNSELVTVAMAVNGPAVHREAPIGTLRYNPVYDPSSSLAESAQAAFGAFAQRSSSGGSGSTHSAGMTTLHHETAYTPLALAAADSVGPLGELVSVEFHSRLLSAGGTTTAVLVPNPAFDLMDDSFDDTPLSASEASVVAATAVALEGGFADSVDVSCMHPVLRLDFAGAATAGVGSIEADTPTPASAAVPVLPLSPVDIAGSPPSRLAGATQEVTPRGAVDSTVASGNQLASPVNPASFGGSADDLLSLLGPELTDSQLSLLAAAPELPYSRPQSRSHSLRLSGSSQQLQQQLLHGYHFLGPFARHREFSGGGAIVVAEGSEARVSREDSTAGSFDFEEISREAAAVVDNLATPHDAAVSAGGLSEGFRAQFRPLMSVDEEVDEPAVRESAAAAAAEAAEQQGMPASPSVKPAKAGLVAAAVRRIESGLTPTGAEAAAAAGNDKATPAGFKSPKPAGKPAGRSSPGIPPRPAFSPGASRPGSVASSSSVLGGRSRRNSRSGSGASLADEQLKGTDAAGFTAAAPVGPAPVVAAEAATGVSLSGSEAPFAPASSRSLGASTSGGSVGDVLALERTLVTREWLPMSGEDSMPDPTAAEQMYGSFLPLSYGSIGVRLHGSGAVLLAADTAPAGMLVEPQGWEQRPRSAGAGGRPSSTPGDAAAGRSVTPGPRPRVQGGSSTSEAAKGGAVGRQRSPAGANMIGAGTAARSKSSSADGSGLFQ